MQIIDDVYYGTVRDKRVSYPLLSFSCYRYAPESFRINFIQKEVLPRISTDGLGYMLLTKGEKAVCDELKRRIRKELRKPAKRMTYGFKIKNSKRFAYISELNCRLDTTLQEKYQLFKEIVDNMERCGWETDVTTEATLGAGFEIMATKEESCQIDKKAPCIVWLKMK